MSGVFIGTGGWAYFHVPGTDLLAAYANAFDFVEVNSTFYTNPSIEMVRSWRRRVPEDFIIESGDSYQSGQCFNEVPEFLFCKGANSLGLNIT